MEKFTVKDLNITYNGKNRKKVYAVDDISFELKAGREAAVKFMDSLKLASIVTHVADAKTSVLHPASHTHRQLNDEQLKAAGISPGLISLSVGIENVEDIIDDLAQALEESKTL